MTSINNRIRYFFSEWYQPRIYMTRDDWIYILVLAISWLLSAGLGLVIGLIWARFI